MSDIEKLRQKVIDAVLECHDDESGYGSVFEWSLEALVAADGSLQKLQRLDTAATMLRAAMALEGTPEGVEPLTDYEIAAIRRLATHVLAWWREKSNELSTGRVSVLAQAFAVFSLAEMHRDCMLEQMGRPTLDTITKLIQQARADAGAILAKEVN